MKKSSIFYVFLLAIVSYGALAFFSEGVALPGWKITALLCLMTFTDYVMKSWRWQILLKHYDMKISFVEAVKTYIAGLVFVITPAKAGEIVKSELMHKRHGFKRKTIVFITLVERAFDIVAHILIAGIGAILVANQFIKSLWGIFGVFAVGIVGLYILRHKISFVKEEIEKLADVKLIIGLLALTIVSWLIEAVEVWIAVQYFGGTIGLVAALFTFSASSVFGNLTMLPGGLGATEAGLTASLIVFSVAKGIAASTTILIRFTTLWFGFLIGALFWFSTYHERLKNSATLE
ncbi:MAG: flippase-like domain-containing protein [Candidatus Altiarchaeota archaeon]|nr:flippase-like domain-containing protein [Candidatus Altiarchaeota archaeon]